MPYHDNDVQENAEHCMRPWAVCFPRVLSRTCCSLLASVLPVSRAVCLPRPVFAHSRIPREPLVYFLPLKQRSPSLEMLFPGARFSVCSITHCQSRLPGAVHHALFRLWLRAVCTSIGIIDVRSLRSKQPFATCHSITDRVVFLRDTFFHTHRAS